MWSLESMDPLRLKEEPSGINVYSIPQGTYTTEVV